MKKNEEQVSRPDDKAHEGEVVQSGAVTSMKPHSRRAILRITPSEPERAAAALTSDRIEHASRCFRADGALLIEDIFDTQIVAEARGAFHKAYSQFLDGSKHKEALMVGDRRILVTVRLEPPFDDAQFYANPYLLPIMSAALDDGFVLGAFGVVCSLPSAPAQHRHDDGGILFPQPGLNSILPAAAITVAIPLIEMNEAHGTTALWLGSHRDASLALKEAAIEPVVREGSCMLWDFRLKHGGTPNLSTLLRPLLYLTYCRPWFVEHLNFTDQNNPRQTPLIATKSFLSGLSDQHRRLLARAKEA